MCMPNNNSIYLIRIGSNSEKEYVKKTISLFSGLVARANLFESSPGMLSSMFLSISSPPLNKKYIIDPATYVFAIDPNHEGSIRNWQKINKDNVSKKLVEDLRLSDTSEIKDDWIREIENPKPTQKNKVEIRGIKKAYRKLADLFFPEEISNFIGRRAIVPSDINQTCISYLVEKTILYQINAISSSKYSIDKYSDFKNEIPEPSFILSPYFNIINNEWFEIMKKVWKIFDSTNNDKSALVVHVDISFLNLNLDEIIQTLSSLKTETIFLWINKFNEDTAQLNYISNFIFFIRNLTERGKKIINLYAGGLSPLLIPYGLAGMVNGPGYGMDKDSEPVIGGIPTAQFYIPTLHRRLPVGESFDLIQTNALGQDKVRFHKEICNCPICKSGIDKGVRDLIFFYGELGEPQKGKDGLYRRFPTTEALERCKFHFIFSRLLEFRWALYASQEDVIRRLDNEISLWKHGEEHLTIWRSLLS